MEPFRIVRPLKPAQKIVKVPFENDTYEAIKAWADLEHVTVAEFIRQCTFYSMAANGENYGTGIHVQTSPPK